MENCIFCKIAKGDVPTNAVFENANVIAFPDIHPVAKGHTLVIPKKHYQWFYEVPREEANEWFAASQTIAKDLKEKAGADYVQLSIVGKDVPHAHIHLIPRKLKENHPGI